MERGWKRGEEIREEGSDGKVRQERKREGNGREEERREEKRSGFIPVQVSNISASIRKRNFFLFNKIHAE